MSYIGNTTTSQAPVTSVSEDRFTGGGNTFPMTRTPISTSNILVVVDGITQGIDAYSIASNILTLTENATDVVVVKHLAYPFEIATVPLNSVGETELQDNSVGETELQTSSLQTAGLLPTAWCTFDGTLTGMNPPITGYNVTNVTRNATGNYNITFENALDTTTYVIVGMNDATTASGLIASGNPLNTTTARVYGFDPHSPQFTDAKMHVIIFGGKT